MKPVQLLLVAHRSHHDHLSTPGLPAIVHANPPKVYEATLMQQSLQSLYDSGEIKLGDRMQLDEEK
jgi:hypothetical protein